MNQMAKIKIRTSDGEDFIIDKADYNAEELAKSLNDTSLNYVAIGDLVLQRYSINRVEPYIEKAEESSEK